MKEQCFSGSIAIAAMRAGLIVARKVDPAGYGYAIKKSVLTLEDLFVMIDLSTDAQIGVQLSTQQLLADDWQVVRIPDTFPTADPISPAILAKLLPDAEEVLEQLFWERHEKMRQIDRLDFKNAIRGAICRMILPLVDG